MKFLVLPYGHKAILPDFHIRYPDDLSKLITREIVNSLNFFLGSDRLTCHRAKAGKKQRKAGKKEEE